MKIADSLFSPSDFYEAPVDAPLSMAGNDTTAKKPLAIRKLPVKNVTGRLRSVYLAMAGFIIRNTCRIVLCVIYGIGLIVVILQLRSLL